jgi:hypothetical protein
MFLEAAAFSVAAFIHFGVLVDGYRHQKAGTAESVIAVVLFVGLALSRIRPASIRTVGYQLRDLASGLVVAVKAAV